jgi:hypothetical protein
MVDKKLPMACTNTGVGRAKKTLALTFLSMTCSMGSAVNAEEPSSKPPRMVWEKLSSEQHKDLKGGGASTTPTLQTKANTEVQHVYSDGHRRNLAVTGTGASAVFHLDAQGAALSHLGRGTVTLASAKTKAELAVQLEKFGLTPDRALDANGLHWLVLSEAGPKGIAALNRLQESGVVISAEPDWQRSLRKK